MLKFAKYQGTGNDFVMVDNRSGMYDGLSIASIQQLCDRRFGIGADGLIKLNAKSGYDFEVDYYNADGTKSFCGNGARCSVRFAHDLGITADHVTFTAIDGVHQAWKKNGLIELEMIDVTAVDKDGEAFVIYTGSPHYVTFEQQLEQFDIYGFGRSVRYNATYAEKGINVNAIEQLDTHAFAIRTYERGVEDETLSCGTGVTAAAMAFAVANRLSGNQKITAQTRGGECNVSFHRDGTTFTEVRLIGPAEFVYKGEI